MSRETEDSGQSEVGRNNSGKCEGPGTVNGRASRGEGKGDG